MRDIVVHESGREIDLQAPTASDEQVLRVIHRRGARRGELRCYTHGGPLYLKDWRGGLLACHWPGTGGAAHPVAIMSEEHRMQVEYIARAATREGLPAEREVALPTHVRPDLVVNGTTAFEVQRSHLGIAKAKARTTKAVRAGMNVSLWISDKAANAAPAWLGCVPSVRVHAAEWKRLPAIATATVESGLSRFEPERCRGGHDARCIMSGYRCSGWRLRREPMLGVTLDSFSVGLAVGLYVPAEVAGATHMVEASHATELGLSWGVTEAMQPADTGEVGGNRLECRAVRTNEAAKEPTVRLLTEVTCAHWIGAAARPCGSTDQVRRYLPGYRCPQHTPAALAGRPEPPENPAGSRWWVRPDGHTVPAALASPKGGRPR